MIMALPGLSSYLFFINVIAAENPFISKQANSIGNLCPPPYFLFELLKMSKLTRGPLVLYHLPKY